MAWAEPQPGGGFRGRYRLPNGDKPTVLQPDGKAWPTKKKAKDAATEAEVLAKRATATLNKNASKYPADTPWGEWWQVLQARRSGRPTRSPIVEASIVKCHLMPAWGKVPLNLIVKKDPNMHVGQVGITEWINSPDGLKERKGMSLGYRRKIVVAFSGTLSSAVDEGIIDFNPCSGLIPGKRPYTERPFLAQADVLNLDLREDYSDLLEFQALTGLRPNEACGLHVHRYNRAQRFITVADVFVDELNLIRGFPKDSDHRRVPLTDRAMEIADKHATGREKGTCPWPHVDGPCQSPLLFMSRSNKGFRPRVAHQVMKTALRKKGLAGSAGMYSARHGFGTAAANGGMNIFDVANIMGHDSLDTTRGYFHTSKDIQERLTRALEGPR